jgi:ABC-2 type transport system permease protein
MASTLLSISRLRALWNTPNLGPSATTVVITPRAGASGFARELSELWEYRHLLRTLVRRELTIRYRGSPIGLLWSLITPLIQILAMSFMVHFVLRAGSKNQTLLIMCSYLAWNFFSVALMDATVSIHNYYGILKKVYFPREIPVIVSVTSNFIHMLISLAVFIVVRWGIYPIFFRPYPCWPPAEVLLLPLLLVLTYLLTLGVSLLLTAFNYFYEDIRFMTQMAMNLMIYLLPIMYSSETIYYAQRMPVQLRHALYHLYLLNPLAWLITAYKQIFFNRVDISAPGSKVQVLSAGFDYRLLGINSVTIIAITVLGYYIFNQYKWKFTERP